jgi:hypothetical protein
MDKRRLIAERTSPQGIPGSPASAACARRSISAIHSSSVRSGVCRGAPKLSRRPQTNSALSCSGNSSASFRTCSVGLAIFHRVAFGGVLDKEGRSRVMMRCCPSTIFAAASAESTHKRADRPHRENPSSGWNDDRPALQGDKPRPYLTSSFPSPPSAPA